MAVVIQKNRLIGPHSETTMYEPHGSLNSFGVSLFFFEGIGVLMPIMKQTRNREAIKKVTISAIITLMFVFIIFGSVLYSYLGNDQGKRNVLLLFSLDATKDGKTEKSKLGLACDSLFALNLMLTYPLTIYQTNINFESFIFKWMERETKTRKCLKNISRSFIIGLGIFIASIFYKSLNSSRGVNIISLGFGIPILMIFPTVCHYKLVSKTQ